MNIKYGRQYIDENDIQGVIEVLKSDLITQGPKIREFEEAFTAYVNTQYAVAVSNATAGLHLAAMVMGVGPGARVITTPISFVATANCIRFCGGEVWFADIDPDTYLLSVDSVKALINSKPKGFFKGIIPVDFAGLPCDLEGFRALADENDLWLVEDACHAPGGYFLDSKDEKQYTGNGKLADVSVFSFHPVKHIACGEGGMITTNSETLYKCLLSMRAHGVVKNEDTIQEGGWNYDMNVLGYNYRLTDIQSALGITQLNKNVKGVIVRNQIAEKYKRAFSGKVKYQHVPEGRYNAYHLFVIEVNNRRALYDRITELGIHAQIHYRPIHTMSYYTKIGYEGADLKNSENYYARCLSLPMYPTLTEEEQDYVIENVLKYYQ